MRLRQNLVYIAVGDIAGAQELPYILSVLEERRVACRILVDPNGTPAHRFLSSREIPFDVWDSNSTYVDDVLWLVFWSNKAVNLQRHLLECCPHNVVLYRESPLSAPRPLGPDGQLLPRLLLVTDGASAHLSRVRNADLSVVVVGKPTMGDQRTQTEEQVARFKQQRADIRIHLGISPREQLVIAWFGGESRARVRTQLNWLIGTPGVGAGMVLMPCFHPACAFSDDEVRGMQRSGFRIVPRRGGSGDALLRVIAADLNVVDIGGTAALHALIAHARCTIMIGPEDAVSRDYGGKHVLVDAGVAPAVRSAADLHGELRAMHVPAALDAACNDGQELRDALLRPDAEERIVDAVQRELHKDD